MRLLNPVMTDRMFGLAAFNRMLRKQQQQQEVEYKVEDAGLNVRQLSEYMLAVH